MCESRNSLELNEKERYLSRKFLGIALGRSSLKLSNFDHSASIGVVPVKVQV